jgi:hypothetical protein
MKHRDEHPHRRHQDNQDGRQVVWYWLLVVGAGISLTFAVLNWWIGS